MAKNDNVFPAEKVAAGMAMGRAAEPEIMGAPYWMAQVECVGPEGVKWRDGWHNAVQVQGKIDLMNRYFGATGGAYNTWYVALHNANATFSTVASMSQWTASEVGGYSASRASFSMASNIATQSSTWGLSYAFTTSTYTVSGLAVCNSAANATAGVAGIVYSMGTFNAGARQVMSADTLNVTLTLSMA
jgi:hypothetical protein